MGIPLQKPYLEIETEMRNGTRNGCPWNGVNFASGGSGVIPATNNYSLWKGSTPLQVQLQQFQNLVEQNYIDKKHMEKSLFFLESGSNDIANYFNPFSDPPMTLTSDAHIQSMLSEVSNYVDTIYKLGARRIGLFALGPVGCIPARTLLPGAPVNKCYGKVNKMVKNYNMGLENLVKDIPGKYPGAVAVYGAVYHIVHIFRANPKRYGFVDVESACCGNGRLGGEVQCGKEGYKMCKNPNQYLFWDLFHPSERTYNLVSKALWTGKHSQIRPFNLKTLANIRLMSL